MNMRLGGLVIIAGMVTVLGSGCAAQSATQAVTPTPTPTVEANAAACASFADLTVQVGEDATGDDPGTDLADIAERFDTVGLTAEGEVRERIDTLIENLPESRHMIVWMENRDAYSEDVLAVARACEAEGHPIQVATLVAAG